MAGTRAIVTRSASRDRRLLVNDALRIYRWLKVTAHRRHRRAARQATHAALASGDYAPRHVRALTGWEVA